MAEVSAATETAWLILFFIVMIVCAYCSYLGFKQKIEFKKEEKKRKEEKKKRELQQNKKIKIKPEVQKGNLFIDLRKKYPAYADSYEQNKNDPAYQAYFGLDPSITDDAALQAVSRSLTEDRTNINPPTESYENSDLLERLKEQRLRRLEEEVETLRNENNRLIEEYNYRERGFRRNLQGYYAYQRMQSRKHRPARTDESYYDVDPGDRY